MGRVISTVMGIVMDIMDTAAATAILTDINTDMDMARATKLMVTGNATSHLEHRVSG